MSDAFDTLPRSGSRATLGAFRKALWEAHGGLCGICGETVAFLKMHVDHIVPSSLGGSDAWANLQPSHRSCNIAKSGGQRAARNGHANPKPQAIVPEGERPMLSKEELDQYVGTQVMIRGLDRDLWLQVRSEAIRRNVSSGALLTQICNWWLARQQG